MIRAVLFDMDGTLLDTERISRVAWNRTFDAMGLEMDSEWWFERISGMNIEAIRTFFLNECGDQFPFDEVRQRRHDFYVELVETDGALCKAGVPEVFDTLQQMGIRQAVASSSSEPWVRRCLGVAGVDISLFDVLMTGEKVERSKPDPEIFLRAAALLGVSPEA
ncbi:MAG: HAD family phosphatase, partial [Clostridia bacterium]|nr:HAD family phosphatase [Clostridia bacterium]